MSRRLACAAVLGLSLAAHAASAQIFWNVEPAPGYGAYAQPYQGYQVPFQGYSQSYPAYPQTYPAYPSYPTYQSPYGYGFVPPPVFYGHLFGRERHEQREWREHWEHHGNR